MNSKTQAIHQAMARFKVILTRLIMFISSAAITIKVTVNCCIELAQKIHYQQNIEIQFQHKLAKKDGYTPQTLKSGGKGEFKLHPLKTLKFYIFPSSKFQELNLITNLLKPLNPPHNKKSLDVPNIQTVELQSILTAKIWSSIKIVQAKNSGLSNNKDKHIHIYFCIYPNQVFMCLINSITKNV